MIPIIRPPHAVDRYKALFDQWHKLADPDFDEKGNPRNKDYLNFRQSFFDYLDSHGGLAPIDYQYKYLAPAEREARRLVVRGGLLRKKRGDDLFDTTGWQLNNGLRMDWKDPARPVARNYPDSNQSMIKDHGIWVMSPEGEFYSGPQTTATGDFHHSAFLAGAPIKGGGEWLVQQGNVKVITGSSGHYKPTFDQFQDVLRTLSARSVDLSKVAAEWPYKNTLTYFNAEEPSQNKVRAVFNEWPKLDGRPLRSVQPLDPLSLSDKAVPGDVAGTPYEGRYLKPKRNKVSVASAGSPLRA